MFCTSCGAAFEETDVYCRECGQLVQGDVHPRKRCLRSQENRLIGGVCAGFAGYYGVNLPMLRVIWVAVAMIPPLFPGLALYAVNWMLMPRSAGESGAGRSSDTVAATD